MHRRVGRRIHCILGVVHSGVGGRVRLGRRVRSTRRRGRIGITTILGGGVVGVWRRGVLVCHGREM